MKRLLPSLREKKRYIVFEGNISKVEPALQKFLGILGMSKVNPTIMKDKYNGKIGIIRINHAFKDEVITALSLADIKVIGISGILKKTEKYLR